KSRSGTIGAQTEQEPEFKALFGKLKKAQTEKYVAPDELKDNILRGKAGLSLSAGPQKTERRDELKESLLKKKEEMVKAAAEKPAPEPKISPAPSSVPEALSVRKQLGRSNSTLNIPAPAKSHRDITPEALSFHKNLRGKPKAPVPEKRSSVTEKAELKRASMDSKPASVADEKSAESVPKTEDKSEPETKELPKPETREPTKPAARELPKRVQQESSKPQVQTRPMSNKIADRFNPALAGLLARGPPSTSNTPPSGSPFSPPAISRVSSAQDEPGEGTQLTHMTKSRAKGPKRRKPKSSAPETTAKAMPVPEKRVSSIASTSEKRVSSIASEPEKRLSSGPSVPEKRISSINSPSPSSPTTKTPVQPRPKSAAVRAASINLSKPPIGEAEKTKTPTPTKSLTFPPVHADKPTTPVSARSSLEVATAAGAEKPKPITPAKPALNTPSSTNTDKLVSPAPFKLPLRTSSAVSSINKEPASGSVSPPASRQPSGFNRALPGKALPGMATAVSRSQDKPLPPLNATEADKENQSFSSVKSAASMWGKPAQTTPQKRAPIELPTKKDEEAAMLSAGLLSNSPLRYNASPKLGLGITEDPINQPKRTNGHDQVQSPSTGAPPKPAKSSRVVSGQLSAKDLPHLPNILDLPAGRELADFFGDMPQSNNQLQLNTDTQTVLGSRSGESDKIKTLRNSIQEIKPDGTLIPLPAQQEHILYESSMYICTHIFYTANMTRMAEVYLWCGDRISESTILETQVHAKRVAREAGVGQKSTQLYIIDQAREPANFFQALGGIVITRRGSRAESLKEPYMLCGRPHMGHIAFDEVDRRKSSLCSEYPYIIARPITLQETKIWLWKGSGCGATAIGSTRLISMDLNPGGGFTEVDEGKETAEFLAEIHDAGDTSICQSPALWKGRCGNWEHSSVRLFRIEAKEKPKQTATSLFTSYFSRRPSWSAPKSPNTDRPNSNGSSKSPNAEFEASISEIAPFTQDDLEPEGCYVLDANSDILVLPGPLLSQQGLWQHAFVQACLFAHDYAILSASLEDRPAIPKARVVFGGLPKEIKVKFRRWEERRGLWGSGSLMAGKVTAEQGDYYNEGAMDLITMNSLKDNEAAFNRYKIRPRVMINVAKIDLKTEIFGTKTAAPFGFSPAAMHGLAHLDGELATSRAAANANICMGLSVFATQSLEDVIAQNSGNPYFMHISMIKDKVACANTIERAEAAGYKAIFLSVDVPVLGQRLNEHKNKFELPEGLRWPNLTAIGEGLEYDATIEWHTAIPWIRSQTKLEIWLKGVASPEDVALAIQHKVDGIMISNHGGRQLDGVPATLDSLRDCASVAKGKIPIAFDGGVRRGSDIFKALALGADFVFMGRVPIWGLAYKGQQGVELAVKILMAELRMTMALAGCRTVKEINRGHLAVLKGDGVLCKL
ncbi:FMN-dependent dehydrogenase, partial [Aureobasidium melanogenum]